MRGASAQASKSCGARAFFLRDSFAIANENLRTARGPAAATALYGPPITSCLTREFRRHVEALDARAVQTQIDRKWYLRAAAAPYKSAAAATGRPFALGLRVFARRGNTHPVQTGLDRNAHLVRVDLGIVLPNLRTRDADLEHVLAVDREIVLNRNARARIERQIVADALVACPLQRVALRM